MLHKSPYYYKYLPEIIDNYPNDQSLNPGTAVLCFPDGVHIDNKYNLPNWFNFIMTDETGNRTYGSCSLKILSTFSFSDMFEIKLDSIINSFIIKT